MVSRNTLSPYACALGICLLATTGAAAELKPLNTWSGRSRDPAPQRLAPDSGFVADAGTWKKLWSAWRPDEKVPPVDFPRELVLVGTVPGPNRVLMRPMVDDQGNVKYLVAGTRIGGPGFGYQLVQIDARGVKTINGQPVAAQNDTAPEKDGTPKDAAADGDVATDFVEQIAVRVTGTLKTGIVAIGGETTGTTITSGNITWELELGKNPDLRRTAQKLDGKPVIVEGVLHRRRGVEVKSRWIVTPTQLRAIK